MDIKEEFKQIEALKEIFKFDYTSINKALDLIVNEIAHLNYEPKEGDLLLAEALGAACTQIEAAMKMYYAYKGVREDMFEELAERTKVEMTLRWTKAEMALRNIKEKQKHKK